MTTPEFSASIVLDSINSSVRLTTVEVEVPLHTWIHILTHRAFSRNAQSNRAIPSKKLLEKANYIPSMLGVNQAGMSPGGILDEENYSKAIELIEEHRLSALKLVEELTKLNIHKEDANRYLAPYIRVTGLLSSTDYGWRNFFNLRCQENTQRVTRNLALYIQELFKNNTPVERTEHFPFITKDEFRDIPLSELKLISAARCARVSYLTHNGTRELSKDLELGERLLKDKHLSPFEHVAEVYQQEHHSEDYGNFEPPWYQYRKEIE